MNLHPSRKPRAARRLPRFRPEVAALEIRALLSVAAVTTYHQDAARDGWNSDETVLTPSNVTASSFGKIFNTPVDGKVDAQPLFVANVAIPGQGVHNVVYVATEHDSVYALDASTGAVLWQVSMLGAGETPSDPVAGSQVAPEIGITSTPVIDAATGTMYVVAMSKNGSTYYQRIHALNITTGADEMTPVSIGANITYPGPGPGGNGTVVSFDPKQYEERDALTLANGVVYTAWASHSDNPPYTGWVIGYRASNLSLAAVLNIDPAGKPTSSFLDDGSGNSFWNSAGGGAVDAAGNLYNLSANGPFDPLLNGAGFPVNGDYGDSILKLAPGGSTGLTVADYFTPNNQQTLANNDEDLGSSGGMLVTVPGVTGSPVQLFIGSGKDGNIYVVDTANLGKYNPNGNNVYQELPSALGAGEFGSPAFFGGLVYFGAVGEPIRAYEFNGGTLATVPISQTSNSFVYPGTTPTVSSNGDVDGIVWAVENDATDALYAYSATNLGDELYDSNQSGTRDQFGAGNKFISPMVADGHVYVGTTNSVAGFGLLNVPPPPSPPPPAPGPRIVTPAEPSSNPVLTTSVALGVTAADANYAASQLTYTWSTLTLPAGADTPAITPNGTTGASAVNATFDDAGFYTFEVKVTDPSGLSTTSEVVVDVVQSPRVVVVAPATATVAAGQAEAFSATVIDQFGHPFTVAVPIAWSLYGASQGTVNSSGVFYAPTYATPGVSVVTATAGAVMGVSTVTITAPALPTFHVAFTAFPALAPAGYTADAGAAFKVQPDGQIDGWNANTTAAAGFHYSPTAPDVLHEGFVAMQTKANPNAFWFAIVPNGTYYVRLIAGDAASTTDVYAMAVNGALAINGRQSATNHWVENTVVVHVTNHLIVVSNARGSRDNKLDAVDVVPVA